MKKALLVGINYNNTNHKLRGCINDVHNIKGLLETHFGFDNPKHIKQLLETNATTKNIRSGLRWLVTGAKAGDVLYFHYSGHGSQIPNQNPEEDYEPDGKDEILCPIDLNWRANVIRDDDFKDYIKDLPKGVNLTVVLDCCHSGDGIRSFGSPSLEKYDIVDRFLPPPTDIVDKLIFNDLPFSSELLASKYENQVAILVSGCRSDQTSADAFLDGQYQGACSCFLKKLLKHNKCDVTYSELVKKLNSAMRRYNFSQRPELNCAKKMKKLKFLQPLG